MKYGLFLYSCTKAQAAVGGVHIKAWRCVKEINFTTNTALIFVSHNKINDNCEQHTEMKK